MPTLELENYDDLIGRTIIDITTLDNNFQITLNDGTITTIFSDGNMYLTTQQATLN
tara:strand:- start:2469 stop:2636 length:168 start_codon:yes stop_codon:yes gene_type:complete